jgi:hypothetical protein
MEQEPQFASQVRVNAHPELKREFVRRVLELPWAFVSDQSSLLDFAPAPGAAGKFLKTIKGIYGLDVSDITTGNLADILERIASKVPRHA